MSNEIQFLLYSMPDSDGKVQVVIKDETIWCTQKAMAQLFGVGVPAISKHLKNIFEEGELDKEVVVSKMEITTQHGAMTDKSQQAKKKAEQEYEIFNKTQRIDSDFDQEIRGLLGDDKYFFIIVKSCKAALHNLATVYKNG